MARTYKRDSRGRFAGGGGGGSRSAGRKPLQRGVNRLTRDNAGRITSQGGSGATARGGRLRTASGNKRATVTARGIGKAPAGTVGRGGKVKGAARVTAKPMTAAKPAMRQRVRGNFRPKNLLTRTDPKSSKGYGTDAKANVAEARRRIASKGATSVLKSNKRSSSVGSVSQNSPNTVNINASHTAWRNPRRDMIKSRRRNEFSTSSANHYAAHELGHVRNPTARMASNWSTQLRGKGQVMADSDKVVQAQRVALRVSRYARQSPAEFTAEVSAALSSGKKFDNEVMRQYRQISGRSARSIRSQMAAANPRPRR